MRARAPFKKSLGGHPALIFPGFESWLKFRQLHFPCSLVKSTASSRTVDLWTRDGTRRSHDKFIVLNTIWWRFVDSFGLLQGKTQSLKDEEIILILKCFYSQQWLGVYRKPSDKQEFFFFFFFRILNVYVTGSSTRCDVLEDKLFVYI